MPDKYHIALGPRTAQTLDTLTDDGDLSSGILKKEGELKSIIGGKTVDVFSVDLSHRDSKEFIAFKDKILKAAQSRRESYRGHPLASSLSSLLDELQDPEGFRLTIPAGPRSAKRLKALFGSSCKVEKKPYPTKIDGKTVHRVTLRFSDNPDEITDEQLEVLGRFRDSFADQLRQKKFNTDFYNLYLFAEKVIKAKERAAEKPELKKPVEEEAAPTAPKLSTGEELYDALQQLREAIKKVDEQIDKFEKPASYAEAVEQLKEIESLLERVMVRKDRADILRGKAEKTPANVFLDRHSLWFLWPPNWFEPGPGGVKDKFLEDCAGVWLDLDKQISTLQTSQQRLGKKKDELSTFRVEGQNMAEVDKEKKTRLVVKYEGKLPDGGIEFRYGRQKVHKGQLTFIGNTIGLQFMAPEKDDTFFIELWENGDNERRIGVFKISTSKKDLKAEFIEERNLFTVHLQLKGDKTNQRATSKWLKEIFKDTSFWSAEDLQSVYFDTSKLTKDQIEQLKKYHEEIPRRAGSVEGIARSKRFGPEYKKLYDFADIILKKETAVEKQRRLAETKEAEKARKAEIDAIKAKLKGEWFPITKDDINAAREALAKKGDRADVHTYFLTNIDSDTRSLTFSGAKEGFDDLDKKPAESVFEVLQKAAAIKAEREKREAEAKAAKPKAPPAPPEKPAEPVKPAEVEKLLAQVRTEWFPFEFSEIEKASDEIEKTEKLSDVPGSIIVFVPNGLKTIDDLRTLLTKLFISKDTNIANDTIKVLKKAVAMRAPAEKPAPPAPPEPKKPARPEEAPPAPPEPKGPTPAEIRKSLNEELDPIQLLFDSAHQRVKNEIKYNNWGENISNDNVRNSLLTAAGLWKQNLTECRRQFKDVADKARKAPKGTFDEGSPWWFYPLFFTLPWLWYSGEKRDENNRAEFVSKCEESIKTINEDLADLDKFITNLKKPPAEKEKEPETPAEEAAPPATAKPEPKKPAEKAAPQEAGKPKLERPDTGVAKARGEAAPSSPRRQEPAPTPESGESPDWKKRGGIEADADNGDPLHGIQGVLPAAPAAPSEPARPTAPPPPPERPTAPSAGPAGTGDAAANRAALVAEARRAASAAFGPKPKGRIADSLGGGSRADADEAFKGAGGTGGDPGRPDSSLLSDATGTHSTGRLATIGERVSTGGPQEAGDTGEMRETGVDKIKIHEEDPSTLGGTELYKKVLEIAIGPNGSAALKDLFLKILGREAKHLDLPKEHDRIAEFYAKLFYDSAREAKYQGPEHLTKVSKIINEKLEAHIGELIKKINEAARRRGEDTDSKNELKLMKVVNHAFFDVVERRELLPPISL